MRLPKIQRDQTAENMSNSAAHAHIVASVLETIGAIAAVIDYDGNLLARTMGLDRLSPDILFESSAGFAFIDRQLQAAYVSALRLMYQSAKQLPYRVRVTDHPR